MAKQRVGTCSNCGGTVVGYRGAWMSVNPPPADHCKNCGGLAKSDVIKIHPPVSPRGERSTERPIFGGPER